jgi:hypothetical protein
MSFVSMLTGAPSCNAFHLKLRDEKKDATNSSRIELHHHSSTVHKGLLLTFHKTGLIPLLLKYYKTVTKYAYVMCDIPPFLLPSLFLSQAHFFVFVVTTLSYCTHVTLQKHCTVLLSCCLLACHRRHLRHISAFTCISIHCLCHVISALHSLASTFLSILSSVYKLIIFANEIVHHTMYVSFIYWNWVVLPNVVSRIKT